MTNVLPLSNIINVTVTSTPSGVSEVNVNNLALFTTEAPTNSDVYRDYLSATQVAEDFGSDSVTTAMAQNIFAQSPNILSGNGKLSIIPLNSSVSATAGTATTVDISSNLSNFQGVTDGQVRVVLNGSNRDLIGLDFTRAVTLSDVAKTIQEKLADVSVVAVGNTLVFTSKKVGTSSTITISSTSAGTDLSGSGFLDGSNAVETTGTNATGETLAEAIARVEGSVSFVGVITNLDIEDAVVEATATAIQAQDRIFLHHFASDEDNAGVITTIKDAAQTQTRCLVYLEGIAEANLYKAAYAGRFFSVNVNGSNTAITMQLKQLANVTPDSLMTQTIFNNCETSGANPYVSFAGVPSVQSNGANDFDDNIYMNLALKFALEAAGFNYLRQTNTKVPQTEAGMTGLKGAYNRVLERFVGSAYIAAGTWNSSETFGDPEIFRENVSNKGYYTYSLPITQQSSIEREARKAPLVQIAVKRAGAIHTGDVLVVVND